ncbi:hypothetical protein TrLO_g12769 [Triparma laevis f. longispina]|uniref:RING-type domain-containing protein n=1 Tax=Triparma laevis f. longispina TaxID=1714387 RepID=A0A9W7ACS0_9STRA|nr:hypothetical protein TrLO_g12769 [Triparma laevis f. longispina]
MSDQQAHNIPIIDPDSPPVASNRIHTVTIISNNSPLSPTTPAATNTSTSTSTSTTQTQTSPSPTPPPRPDTPNPLSSPTPRPPTQAPPPTPSEVLTSRLRLFFGLITCLIIPTATTLFSLLIWLLISIRSNDSKQCDQPLEAYAYCALIVAVYTPQHRKIKKYVFRYDRERDGPRRPRKVLIFDRAYQVCFLLYAILGIVWVRDCETCQDTAPQLYKSALTFVICQTVLLILLLLPLMCVPCIFIYLLRSGVLFADPNGHPGRPMGLDKSVFEQLPLIKFNPELFDNETHPTECCICMVDFDTTDDDKGIIKTPCEHVFHKECLATWLKNHRHCPLCRKDLGMGPEDEEAPAPTPNETTAITAAGLTLTPPHSSAAVIDSSNTTYNTVPPSDPQQNV